MISRRPFQVRECTIGTGGACGAIFLTEYFKELLIEKIGPENKDVLTPRRVAEAVNSFERNIKFTYDPYTVSDQEDNFEIPLPGAPDLPDINLLEGYLTLSRHNAPEFDQSLISGKSFFNMSLCHYSGRSLLWCMIRLKRSCAPTARNQRYDYTNQFV